MRGATVGHSREAVDKDTRYSELDAVGLTSLFLEVFHRETWVSSATGFIVSDDGKLVTNYHVILTTEEPQTSLPQTPTHVRVHLLAKADATQRIQFDLPLFAGGTPLWREHPGSNMLTADSSDEKHYRGVSSVA